MRHLVQSLLVTLVRGILFLVPIVLLAVLAREGYGVLRRVSQPVARLLPEDRLLGILAEDLLTIAAGQNKSRRRCGAWLNGVCRHYQRTPRTGSIGAGRSASPRYCFRLISMVRQIDVIATS